MKSTISKAQNISYDINAYFEAQCRIKFISS